jgi:Acetyltransferase (GNAT) domain
MGIFCRKIPGSDALPESWDYKSPAGIKVIGVRKLEDLATHADAWDKLLQQNNASPLTSYAWINAYFAHLVEDHESWISLFAYQDDELIGVLPLVVRRAIRVAGRSLILFRTPFDLMHSGAVDCLMSPDNPIALGLFFDYLSRIPSAWPIISFKELVENSQVAANLDSLKACSLLIPTTLENHIILPESYEVYHASLSSNLRRLIKRSTKKLNQQENVKFIMREDQRSVENNMKEFMEAEHANWKGESGGSIKSHPEHAAALLMAAEEFTKRGWMEWNFIEVDNQTIAAHYSIRVNRTVYAIKIGFADKYNFCSPGNLLLNKMIENSFACGDVDEINLTADCRWHAQWGITSQQFYDCLIIPQIPIVSAIIKLIFRLMRKSK